MSEVAPDFALNAPEKVKDRTPKPKLKPKESSEFDKFWSIYPRKDARLDALKAWHNNQCDANIEQILAGVKRQLKSFKPGFIPLGATYINGARWEDQGVAAQHAALPNAYGKGTALQEQFEKPPQSDETTAGLNLLLVKVVMESHGVHADCMDQLVLSRNFIRQWIGDRIFTPDQSVIVAARAKAKWREIIREFNIGMGRRGADSDAGDQVSRPRSVAAESAALVGDAF